MKKEFARNAQEDAIDVGKIIVFNAYLDLILIPITKESVLKEADAIKAAKTALNMTKACAMLANTVSS